jgi:hypothetical protein
MWKKHRKSMTVIVYDNKNLHITELEEARPVHRKTFDIFSDLNWKDNKTLICTIS